MRLIRQYENREIRAHKKDSLDIVNQFINLLRTEWILTNYFYVAESVYNKFQKAPFKHTNSRSAN